MKLGCIPHSNDIGVLLVQLGTPDAPTSSALRRYLKEFLSDPRVIEKNRFLWWLLLNGIILNVRPKKSAALYKRVWTEEGSPLLVYTKKQQAYLQESLQDDGVTVAIGMRYGNPSIAHGVNELIEAGCRRILLVPLYPQYAGATTGSTYDATFAALQQQRWVPTLKVIDPYFAHPEFIASWAHIINDYYDKAEEKPEKLILSYHGIPYEYVQKGDPYCCQCTETTQALLPHLNIAPEKVIQTFQSRFGSDIWLQPYTDKTVESLGEDKVSRIAVACPGFVTDCLETIDEIGVEAEEEFIEAGGEHLDLIPCLNDHTRWLEGLHRMIRSEIREWLEDNQRRTPQASPLACPMKTFLQQRKDAAQEN